ncbi:MAG TPA: DUF1684 domain-containing protein [Vicinamibacteria bacterium]|nr:DUF1684 domain-containing protein [Vicinamibacteria bacterium]
MGYSTSWIWLVSASILLPWAGGGEDAAYLREIESWRAERETNLKKDGSWLTVAGLYWLREGENTVGADPENDFVLPEGTAPAFVGAFTFENGKVGFRAREGVTVTQKGEDAKPVATASLEPGEKNAIVLGNLSMWVHASGPRLAIRLRDLDSPIRKEFTGLQWFPVDPAYRVTAKFTPHPKPKDVEILNMLGDIERYQSPGVVDFELQGKAFHMEPVSDSDGGLWFIFKDQTSGKETYPSARFLRTDDPKDGSVVVDFNKAYNPPCAFNPYTTCPMPPKENRLKVRIEAGEKNYKKHS